MATINKAEIVKRIVNALRLDPGIESTPKEIADKIVPVFVINEIGGERVIHDSVANSNSKTWTVPDGEKWKLKWIYTSYVSNATAGNRQVLMTIDDNSGNEIFRCVAGFAQAANDTRHYIWQPKLGVTTIGSTMSFGTCPPILYEGMVLTVEDTAGISATDDMSNAIVFEEMSMEA